MPDEQTTSRRRYTSDEIRNIRNVIRDVGVDANHAAIADALNEKGIVTASGSTWYATLVSNFLRTHGLRRTRGSNRRVRRARRTTSIAEEVEAEATTEENDKIELAQLVLASTVSKSRKLKLLSNLL